MTAMTSAADPPPRLLPATVAISLALHALIVAAVLTRGVGSEAQHEAEASVDMPFAGVDTKIAPQAEVSASATIARDAMPERLVPVVPQVEALPSSPATGALPVSPQVLPQVQPRKSTLALSPSTLAERSPDIVTALRTGPTVSAGMPEVHAGELLATSPAGSVAAGVPLPEIVQRDMETDAEPAPATPVQAPQDVAAPELSSARPDRLPASISSILPLAAIRPLEAGSVGPAQEMLPSATPAETLAALPPALDATKPSVPSAAAVDRFLAHYDGGPCFSATRTGNGPHSTDLDVFSPSVERIVALHNAFAAELGMQPDVLGQHIWSGQCDAVDFLRRTTAPAGGTALHVARRRLQTGESLTGEVRRVLRDKAALYWVRETGAVVDLTPAVVWSGPTGTFTVPVPIPVSGALAPEMLLLISGPDLPQIDTFSLAKTEPAHLTGSGLLVLVGP